MVTYRYSESAIESLAQKAARRSFAIILVAMLLGLAVGWGNGGLRDPLPASVTVGILVAGLFWTWRRSIRNFRTVAKSTEFELDEDALTARSSIGTTKLGRGEITQIRHLSDGILVRGADLRHTVQLKPELEGFQELAARIQDWAPESVRRTHTSSSYSRWLTSVIVGNLGLMFIALSATTPAVAIPSCILEAVFLLGLVSFVWRSDTIAQKVKWMMLIAVVPAVSLIARAYQLSQSH
jgi:hypothetical protein